MKQFFKFIVQVLQLQELVAHPREDHLYTAGKSMSLRNSTYSRLQPAVLSRRMPSSGGTKPNTVNLTCPKTSQLKNRRCSAVWTSYVSSARLQVTLGLFLSNIFSCMLASAFCCNIMCKELFCVQIDSEVLDELPMEIRKEIETSVSNKREILAQDNPENISG